jgi:hypothetical protein
VHTNKTLKKLRKMGAFKWTGTTLEILDEEKLEALVGPVTEPGMPRPFI